MLIEIDKAELESIPPDHNELGEPRTTEQASLYGWQLSDGFVVPAVVSAVLWGVEVAVGKIT